MFKRVALLTTLAAVNFSSSVAFASIWSIDQTTARLSFASVKNDHIAELHRFTDISGTWSESNVVVRIPISGLDTLIPIRNERMAEHLFNAAKYPFIEVNAAVLASQIEPLKVGESMILELALTVEIAAQRAQVPAMLQVTKTHDKRLLATTIQPIMIDSKRFDLIAGIEKLSELAGLKRIDLVIPVTFSVTFTQPS